MLVGPREDAALQVADVHESLLAQELLPSALRPPLLQWTMISCCGPVRRIVPSSGSGKSVLPGMRQIWNSSGLRTSRMIQLFAAIHALFQFLHGDVALLTRCDLWFGRMDAAELFVIDQLGDGRLIAADGAFRIAPDLELAEGHLPGIVEQQPADQRLALAQHQLDASVAWMQPTRPGRMPSTPPSAQLGTSPGGGGSG